MRNAIICLVRLPLSCFINVKCLIVIGPVADDNTMETVQLYISGILTSDEAVKRLRYSKVNNEVSFHTEKALAYLRFIGREKHE